jgi:hypothetical protein
VAADKTRTYGSLTPNIGSVSAAIRWRPDFLTDKGIQTTGNSGEQTTECANGGQNIGELNMTPLALSWDHEAAELRTMPLDALALLVLADFDGGWNVRNYFLEARQYHNAIYRQDGVAERIAEAWAWLEAHALIGRHPTQDSSDARMITESGRHALENGLDRLRAGQRLGMELHPLIAGRVRTQFLMGEFELAAFQAMREVEIRVRSLSGFGEDQIGVPLMTMAFNPNEKMRGHLSTTKRNAASKRLLWRSSVARSACSKIRLRIGRSTTPTQLSGPKLCYWQISCFGFLTA